MPPPNLTEMATTTQRSRKMPVGPTNTKAQKQKVMHTEMSKFKEGNLHSGSKTGPVVKNRKQAVAIGLSESGQSKKAKPQVMPPAKGPAPSRGFGESKPNYDRSGHFKDNPGFPNSSKGSDMGKGSKGKFGNIPANNMGSNLVDKTNTGHVNQPSGHSVGAGCSTSHVPSGMGGKAHSFPGANSGLKLSGNPRAHRIGKR